MENIQWTRVDVWKLWNIHSYAATNFCFRVWGSTFRTENWPVVSVNVKMSDRPSAAKNSEN